jgi:hypothetical protein
MLVADEIVWSVDDAGVASPTERLYRCTVCRDQRGGTEHRQAPLDPDDLVRAVASPGIAEIREWAADRFPVVDGAPTLVDELLDLHTPRQLIGLVAIMQRVEGDLRAAPILAALRLAFAHALLPASRLGAGGGRSTMLRVASGHVRPASDRAGWRERNPWLAFEDGMRTVRGFVQRLEGGAVGPLAARLGEDLLALAEGGATTVLAVASPSAGRALAPSAGSGEHETPTGPKIRLVLGQPVVRPNLDRLASSYQMTGWTLGREAASLMPIDALAGPSLRAPWSWQAVSMARSLTAIGPSMARDGRIVQLIDGGAESLAAVAIGAASAGYRVVMARLAEPDDSSSSVIELAPPGAVVPPGPRTRANVGLAPIPGGAGDPDLVPGRGLFAPPERFDQRPFSPTDAARAVTDAAVESLRARGEPARFERLFGEILVGLDRSGQLRRLAAGSSPLDPGRTAGAPGRGAARADSIGADTVSDPAADREGMIDPPYGDVPTGGSTDIQGSTIREKANRVRTSRVDIGDGQSGGATSTDPSPGESGNVEPGTVAPAPGQPPDATDPVERLMRLIRGELTEANERLTEIEPDRWWLRRHEDEAAAAPALADRVEWAVFSLLSTAGPMSEAAFYDRIATMFVGHDLPDETLVRACLESYRSPDSTPDRLVTRDELLTRSQEHADLLAAIAEGGHRRGLRVWLSPREQARRHGPGTLGDLLDDRERHAYLGSIAKAVDDVADVDAIWYVRSKVAFLFEVEWTAILADALLRRHARIGVDDRLIRFLVIAPERTDLVRYKLERSPLLRAAIDDGGWNIIKWPHLRDFLAMDGPGLDGLEPLIGLDPVVERGGEQMPLFQG